MFVRAGIVRLRWKDLSRIGNNILLWYISGRYDAALFINHSLYLSVGSIHSRIADEVGKHAKEVQK